VRKLLKFGPLPLIAVFLFLVVLGVAAGVNAQAPGPSDAVGPQYPAVPLAPGLTGNGGGCQGKASAAGMPATVAYVPVQVATVQMVPVVAASSCSGTVAMAAVAAPRETLRDRMKDNRKARQAGRAAASNAKAAAKASAKTSTVLVPVQAAAAAPCCNQ
jgi:hypothetical protein